MPKKKKRKSSIKVELVKECPGLAEFSGGDAEVDESPEVDERDEIPVVDELNELDDRSESAKSDETLDSGVDEDIVSDVDACCECQESFEFYNSLDR